MITNIDLCMTKLYTNNTIQVCILFRETKTVYKQRHRWKPHLIGQAQLLVELFHQATRSANSMITTASFAVRTCKFWQVRRHCRLCVILSTRARQEFQHLTWLAICSYIGVAHQWANHMEIECQREQEIQRERRKSRAVNYCYDNFHIWRSTSKHGRTLLLRYNILPKSSILRIGLQTFMVFRERTEFVDPFPHIKRYSRHG